MDLLRAISSYCLKLIVVQTVLDLRSNISADILSVTSSKRSVLDNKVTSERLLWKHNERGTGLCVGRCNRLVECSGVFFNKETDKCQGHSLSFGSAVDTATENGWRYYILPRGVNYIGDTCSNNTDCQTTNSECRNFRCLCVPGYSFSPRSRDCLPVCSTYGADFLEVRDHYISGTNMEIFEGMSLQGCFELCRNRTSFTCKSLEYGRSSLKCYLADVTKLDVPSSWFHDDVVEYNISYYQRDCG